jgi:diketogulonate reductase-like aldo/keto reductase
MHPIDPNLIPRKPVPGGMGMPVVGLGTFGSDRFTGEQVAAGVESAIRMGYRHIDCASVYGNEHLIGPVLKRLPDERVVRRDELWITSKVWNDQHAPADVVASCEKSLRDLRLDHLDLYLVHWPFPNHHPPGCDVGSRSPDATPYVHERYMATWGAMEKLVQHGKVRHIGTSNMTIPKLKLLLRDAAIRPIANEMELHPHFQQPQLFDYVRSAGLIPIGYSPIGSPARPERDRTPDDTVDIEDPAIVRIAGELGVHPATLCVKWAVQRGQVPIPFSVNPRNMHANLASVLSPPLSGEQMRQIAAIDRNCRLIKGQVFLWKNARDWPDLWDEDGVIRQ